MNRRQSDLIRFSGDVLMLAVPLWLVAGTSYFVWSQVNGEAVSTRLVAVGVSLGSILAVPAAAGLRQCLRFVAARKTLFGWTPLFAPLIAACIWFVCMRGVEGSGDAGIWRASFFFAAVAFLFAIPYPLKNALTNRRRERREANWRRRPKLGLGSGGVGSWTIDDDLRILQDSIEGRRGADTKRVGDLRKMYQIEADPRLKQMVPLTEAVELITGNSNGVFNEAGATAIDTQGKLPPDLEVPPVVLVRALRFLVEYGFKSERRVSFHFHMDSSAEEAFCLSSNIAGGDLWFQFPDGSAATKARDKLVVALNEYLLPADLRFEFGDDCRGQLQFRFFLKRGERTFAPEWRSIENELGSDLQLLSRCPFSNGTGRVYRQGDFIHKISVGSKMTVKLNPLENEWQILSLLKGTKGIPETTGLMEKNGFLVMTSRRIDGIPIGEYLLATGGSRREFFKCIANLSSVLDRMHRRGVVHRDVTLQNVLVAPSGEVSLIDFDQALGGTGNVADVDLIGESDGIRSHSSVKGLISELQRDDLYNEIISDLSMAWKEAAVSDASSPGVEKAYYEFLFGYHRLPGERPWIVRWNLLEDCVLDVVRDKTVLELGCNSGLLGTHCALQGAKEVIGVDYHESILTSARRIARTAGVSSEFIAGDLSEKLFVEALARKSPDVVFALSVLHWLTDKGPVMEFLATVPCLFYEGHEPISMEIARLRELGFKTVRVLGYSERLRPVYFASHQ